MRVRNLFGVPRRLQDAEFLRREIAARMQERLALIRLEPQRVLDAGCGAGPDMSTLQRRFPLAQVLGLDAACAMLAQARAAQNGARSSLQRALAAWLPAGLRASGLVDDLVCGDFARLPLAPNSVDLVWSNLALHWHPCPDQVFAEWRRVLRTDGLLMFSCFGPDSLKELRGVFAGLDQYAHTLPFVDMHDFGDMLVQAGFATPVMDMETITVTYDNPDKLLAEVRALGGNPLDDRRRGLIGRTAWQSLRRRLEALRGSDGRFSLTFEVIYGHAFRPVPTVTARGESIIRLDFPRRG